MTEPVATSDRDSRAAAPAREAPAEPQAACQICGATHRAEDPILCRVCGEPVIVWGWAP